MNVDGEMVRAMRARAGDLATKLERMTGALSDLQERIHGLTATAVSRDGLVQATVGSDGRPRDLRLDPRIYRGSDAEHLARTILDTIAVAADEARERAVELCRPYAPEAALRHYAAGDVSAAMERLRQQLPFLEME